jgi:predicted 3-demethylubiquinone-9 3-methyltransferase (glyoxalase superfamily)
MQINAKSLTPCLWFDTQAEQAANHYVSIFKNAKIGKISRYGGEGQDVHGKPAGSVMVVEFEINEQTFVALNGGPHFKFNEAVSFQVHCDNQDEIDYFWNRLGEGGAGEPVRLAQGQVRALLAGRPERTRKADERVRPGRVGPRHEGVPSDDEVRYCRARARLPGRMRNPVRESLRRKE